MIQGVVSGKWQSVPLQAIKRCEVFIDLSNACLPFQRGANVNTTIRLLILGDVFLVLASCGGDNPSPFPNSAPTLKTELQSGYKTDGSGSAEEWNLAVADFKARQASFNLLGNTIAEDIVDPTGIKKWDPDFTYDFPGNRVKYASGDLCGAFANAWRTQGDTPSFVPFSTNPWMIIELMKADCTTFIVNNITDWAASGEYNGGSYVSYGGQCYLAKYWTKGDIPNPDPENPWDTPWEVTSCDGEAEEPLIDPVGGGKIALEVLPYATNTADFVLPDGSPVVPPVILSLLEESSGPVITADSELPSTGYEFLRLVTATHWEWLFRFRSGKYDTAGDIRNVPPIAQADGSTDVYTLSNFVKAVLLYNAWALEHNYKQFLNEGTIKQQAQEFIAFWAKSARETSGSWKDAPEPWIINYTNSQGETTAVWKGALYWIEERDRSTASDGTSKTIEYVDKNSSYKPVAGRSYYGRGIIQLSWNYNYGPFSNWLYDNGFMPDRITSRDILLTRPDYVATYAEMAMLSGIWFWMTPQGAKPSCHDVLYGDVVNISKSTQEQGLPPRNDGGPIPVAVGDTTDESILAYRIGSIINIVNGGQECNKMAAWHSGPMHRLSYFNAYTMYFNDQLPEVNATRITDATNVWNQQVSDSSPDIMKMASCYAQKSYYSW